MTVTKSNVTTSQILTVLSAPHDAKLLPSQLTATLLISPACARNSLTNSTASDPATFFQKLTWPSALEVMRKSVFGVIVTKDSWSLCMRDFE